MLLMLDLVLLWGELRRSLRSLWSRPGGGWAVCVQVARAGKPRRRKRVEQSSASGLLQFVQMATSIVARERVRVLVGLGNAEDVDCDNQTVSRGEKAGVGTRDLREDSRVQCHWEERGGFG